MPSQVSTSKFLFPYYEDKETIKFKGLDIRFRLEMKASYKVY